MGKTLGLYRLCLPHNRSELKSLIYVCSPSMKWRAALRSRALDSVSSNEEGSREPRTRVQHDSGLGSIFR